MSLKWTKLREELLQHVEKGHVFNRRESGCVWVDRVGMKFRRGWGLGLTTLRRQGLIAFGPELPVRTVGLTEDGEKLLAEWRKQ